MEGGLVAWSPRPDRNEPDKRNATNACWVRHRAQRSPPKRTSAWFGELSPARYVAELGVEIPGILVAIRMTAFID